MQELSAADFRTDEEPESREQDMADDGGDGQKQEMEEWGRAGSPPRSTEEITEDIRRTPPHKRTEVLSLAALTEQRKKSPPTCKYHCQRCKGLCGKCLVM